MLEIFYLTVSALSKYQDMHLNSLFHFTSFAEFSSAVEAVFIAAFDASQLFQYNYFDTSIFKKLGNICAMKISN